MPYAAEIILKALETRLLERGTAAKLERVADTSYQALSIWPEPFNPREPQRRNTILMWSLMAVSGDSSDDVDQIKLYCKLADPTPQACRSDVLEYLNYANLLLDFGMFCIDSEEQVVYKYAYPLMNHQAVEPTAEALTLALDCVLFSLKTGGMPLQKLMNDTVTLAEAKKLLELLLEIIDDHVDD